MRLLLDTNALIWFLAAEFMKPEALVAITQAQKAGSLYLSPVPAWEAALALNKANPAKRPNLNGQDAATWFRQACATTGAKIARIGSRIALEAARVPLVSGNGDPGDALIAEIVQSQPTGHQLRLLKLFGPLLGQCVYLAPANHQRAIRFTI